MANIMRAMREYMPGIQYAGTISMKALVMHIAGRTSLNRGTIHQMLIELQEALVYFGSQGMNVKMDGVGTFTPTVQLDGTFGMAYRADNEIKNQLNDQGRFSGTLKNRDMIGLSQQDIIERWNSEHPDDPIKVKTKDKPKK